MSTWTVQVSEHIQLQVMHCTSPFDKKTGENPPLNSFFFQGNTLNCRLSLTFSRVFNWGFTVSTANAQIRPRKWVFFKQCNVLKYSHNFSRFLIRTHHFRNCTNVLVSSCAKEHCVCLFFCAMRKGTTWAIPGTIRSSSEENFLCVQLCKWFLCTISQKRPQFFPKSEGMVSCRIRSHLPQIVQQHPKLPRQPLEGFQNLLSVHVPCAVMTPVLWCPYFQSPLSFSS